MTQENMEILLTDMGKDASCISEGACEVETLRNLQASYGITGKVTDFGGTYLVTLQLYETRGGTLVTAEKVKSTEPIDLVTELAPAATRALLASLKGETGAGVASGSRRVPTGDVGPSYRVFFGKDPLADKSAAYRSMARQKRQQSITILSDLLQNRSPQGSQQAEMLFRLGEAYMEECRDQFSNDVNKTSPNVCVKAKDTLSAVTANTRYVRRLDAVYMLAVVSELLGDEAAAVPALMEVAASSSAFAHVASLAVAEYLYLVKKEPYKAIESAKHAQANAELASEVHYILAWSYLSIGQSASAAEEWKKLEQAIEGGTNSSLAKAVTAERAQFAP